MSTDHAHDHDPEYGPTPPGAKYEHTDIDVSVGYKFGLWLVVSMLISIAIVTVAFYYFEGQGRAANAAAQKYPLAVGQQKRPPTPNLQNQPFKDIYTLRQGETERLGSYGWVDKDGGIARLPIDRAMDVMLEKGFPTRAAGSPGADDALNVVTQDSSSGRTVVPR
jgi:hypothetical protein